MFCNRVPYYFIETLSQLVSRDLDECLEVKGLVRRLQRTQLALLMWLSDDGFSSKLSAGRFSYCLLFLCISNKEEQLRQMRQNLFQLHGLHISFQLPPMRNMIWREFVVLRQKPAYKRFGGGRVTSSNFQEISWMK